MTRWNWKGAQWWRFDFHTHTPASKGDYGMGRDREELMKRTPREWLLDYMQAGIDCVAITDHNTGAWIDELKSALAKLESEKPQGYRPLYLFPGMEISVNAGIHLLAIFDGSAITEDMTVLLGLVGYTGDQGKCDDETSKPFEDVVAAIDGRGGIAIPAHVDKENGLLRVEPNRTLRNILSCQNILAMELIDPAYPKPQIYQEEAPNWTEVVGSDARHPSGALGQNYPGSRFTWVKMGEPCLEGLRLALLDGPLSVRRSDQSNEDPNTHASCVIESIEVSDARYMGCERAFKVPLNPWLNAVIGGRGTGKSTLVEFLRIALRRTDGLPEAVEKSIEKYNAVYGTRNDTGLLTDATHFTVTYRKDDVRYRIQWSQAGDAVPIEVETGPDVWEPAQGDIDRRFPIRIFSQKQIYALADNPLGLLKIVDEAPKVDRLNLDRAWRELETKFLSLRAKAREIESGLSEEDTLRGELEDVKRKLVVFEQAGHAQILKDYRYRDGQQKVVDEWEDSWRASGDRIRELAQDLALAPLDAQAFESADPADSSILKASTDSAEQIAGIAQKLNTIAEDADNAVKRWKEEKVQSQWHQALASTIQSYAVLVRKLADEGVEDPRIYGELVQRKQSIESRLKALDDRRRESHSLRSQADACLGQLVVMRHLLTKKRADFLSQTLKGSQYVHIQVLPYQAREEVESKFREIIQREDGRFKYDIDGLLRSLYSDKLDVRDLEAKLGGIKRKVRDIAEGNTDPGSLQDRRFAAHLAKLPPELLDRFDLWFPEDSLKVEYYREAGGSRPTSIDQGSPGQKSAALLWFLLSYGDEPLVLDQPEDDLDNHVIYDLIVTQLREIKRRRQVIVVTHNANIVVNGDAELVIALEAKGGQTHRECCGILQEKKVRDTICDVMEGGKAAFEKRYRRMTSEDRHV
ncbi:MAG TPA: AAA family ATPase [bacterium]|nr:AAA family ATPase [bacterium]